jgi:hypothetical protein
MPAKRKETQWPTEEATIQERRQTHLAGLGNLLHKLRSPVAVTQQSRAASTLQRIREAPKLRLPTGSRQRQFTDEHSFA